MKVKFIALLLCFVCSTGLAQEDKGWQERLRQTEKEFKQLKVEVDVMYKMLSQIYLQGNKKHSQEQYHELIFGLERKCLFCGKEEEK